MQYTFRPATPADFRASEELTRKAFTGLELPTGPRFTDPDGPPCDEHMLLHILRDSEFYIPELDMVAEDESGLVGHIVYSKSRVVRDDGVSRPTITFGPLSVHPQRQRQGIGAALVRHSMDTARELGYNGIVIFGHPAYYPRFGFDNAARFGITTAEGENFDAFMACPLAPGSLDKVKGKFVLEEIFHIPPDELREFDRQFV